MASADSRGGVRFKRACASPGEERALHMLGRGCSPWSTLPGLPARSRGRLALGRQRMNSWRQRPERRFPEKYRRRQAHDLQTREARGRGARQLRWPLPATQAGCGRLPPPPCPAHGGDLRRLCSRTTGATGPPHAMAINWPCLGAPGPAQPPLPLWSGGSCEPFSSSVAELN